MIKTILPNILISEIKKITHAHKYEFDVDCKFTTSNTSYTLVKLSIYQYDENCAMSIFVFYNFDSIKYIEIKIEDLKKGITKQSVSFDAATVLDISILEIIKQSFHKLMNCQIYE